MILLLLLSVFGGLAVADEADPSPSETGAGFLPTGVDSPDELAPLTENAEPIETALATDPEAAEELPHTDLARAEAEELLRRVFGKGLEGASDFYDSLNVEAFRSDYVAVVAPKDGGDDPGLLSSLLPLRNTDESGANAVIDLDLERTQGGLQPENPLVDVTIPGELSEGIDFPEAGVRIDVATGETDRGASEVGDASAFFPNVRPDSDLVVSAIPTGVETYTHLRSPEAPRTETFDLQIENGQLRATAAGGAEVVGPDGGVRLAVSPPSAVDAEGDPVPVGLEVAGNSIVVTADPPADAAYPILVDPVFENYNFSTGSSTGLSDWSPASNSGFRTVWNWPQWGMNAVADPGATSPGNQAMWNYYVPRYWSDIQAGLPMPTTYIERMNLWNLEYRIPDEAKPNAAYPFMQMGLWSDTYQQFVAYGYRDGTQGELTDDSYTYKMVNPNQNSDVKRGGFAIANWNSSNPPLRYVNVGQAWVEITDKDVPAFGEIGTVPEWVNTKAGTAINFKVTDPGIGIHNLRLEYPRATGGSSQPITGLGCTGNTGNPCPRTVSKATKPIPYYPDLMPQGEDWAKVYGVDGVGHWSEAATTRIKVDHTAPALTLSGNLTEQATVGTKLPEYTLNYAGTDGDDAAAAASSPVLGKGTGAGSGQMQRPMDVAVDASGNVFVVDRENNRVEKFDPSGNLLSEFDGTLGGGSKFSDPRGIAITAAGNIWVTEVGAKRLQEFNSKGEFIRKFTYEGEILGTGKFVEPVGVAAGPNETLWVTDIGSHRVYRFKETGTYLGGVSGLPLLVTMNLPTGVDVDAFGNAWIAEQNADKIYEFDSTGKYLFSLGGPGSESGQFNDPNGIAITASGNVLVADANNNRLQEFETDGSFLRKFASTGTGNDQLTEPRGIAIGPGNSAYIADAGNHRIAKWTHVDQDPQSGVAELLVKVDGVTALTKEPGCATKNCTLSGSWALKADNYAVGPHKVEVIATDGVGLATTKTLNVETHGDLLAPSVVLSGTMTEQATLGTTRPSYKLTLAATDPGSAEERKSGVASTSIKVDGVSVDSSAPGCPGGGCSITREWTINSSSYSVGTHLVEAKATDAAGRTTTKTLSVKIERDTTPPALTVSGTLPEAPEGWVEQITRNAVTEATDEGGYGVRQIRISIDGELVGMTLEQSCAAGGCPRSKTFLVDISQFNGGAHEAVITAEDLAGNVRKKTWTVNVDPEGNISASEAEDTLEALEDTTDADYLEPSANDDVEGTVQGLEVQEAAEGEEISEEAYGFTVSGSGAPVGISTNPKTGFGVGIPPESGLQPACEQTEAGPPYPTPQEEEERAEAPTEDCASGTPSGEPETELVTVAPSTTAEAAHEVVLSASETAAISTNYRNQVDLLTLPLYDGGMTIATIRDEEAPTEYSWQVHLEPDQKLTLLDLQHAAVYYDAGPAAFSITATLAHDAIGTNIPTSLSVSGNVLTLTVNHRALGPNGQPFVYPVVAGAGWEGGFQTAQIEMPPAEGEEEPGGEEEEASYGGGDFPPNVKLFTFGPPMTQALDAPTDGLLPSDKPRREKAFKFTYCVPHNIPADPVFDGHAVEWWFVPTGAAKASAVEETEGKNLPKLISECHREDFNGVFWGVTVFGRFHYIKEHWVWTFDQQVHCHKWGEEQPAQIHCKALVHEPVHGQLPVKAVQGPLDVVGEYRFPLFHGQWPAEARAACFTLGGKLYPNPRTKTGPYERPMIWHNEYIIPKVENCPWW